MQPTDNVAAEKGIDPAHNQRIRDNHGHVILHHAHHAIHLARVRKRVRRRLALPIRFLEKLARLVAAGEGIASGLKRLARQRVVIGAQGGAAGEGSLFA